MVYIVTYSPICKVMYIHTGVCIDVKQIEKSKPKLFNPLNQENSLLINIFIEKIENCI